MSASSSHPPITKDSTTFLIRSVNTQLIVRQLQSVLKQENQPTSGLKASLQKRLSNYIESIARSNDTVAFERVKRNIYNSVGNPNNDYGYAHRSATGSAGIYSPADGYSVSPGQGATAYVNPASISNCLSHIHFKKSPFYTIVKSLSDHGKCPVAMSVHRNVVNTTVSLNEVEVHQLSKLKNYRAMIYCAVVEPLMGYTSDTDIAFPHQVELRVNQQLISGLNLRGLKNKPGSTRPADITDKLNLRENFRNEISLTYAQTQKEFVFLVNLVQTETVEDLVAKLQQGRSIPKEEVISDMVKKNSDTDLIATSVIMSLKCPLSTLRIQTPVRSLFCTHVQCFDATSFLQLQQQAPTWTCPTCNKSITFDQLVKDMYFDDILHNTPSTVDSVTIDPEGKWSAASESSNSPIPDDSDDDEPHKLAIKREIVDLDDGPPEIISSSTPVHSDSRANSASVQRSSNKRAFSQVIDLTLSDDEEETPRPAKRTNHNERPPSSSIENGYHSSSVNGYSP
ncbi:Similar to E3 SUMO-protein ligase pli1; acc. no. O94451 [Pyronema omphalodes CBS 100304]|uniref:Similar to E3 SUMO-protein ligase pli1 acc. no. O94451 n=1 Tax=Pyronema omphalodes (strain CBS 100304) TaxID=1076935 RepID=U4KYF7_PYROM|nr:Similar to E3 SUMO-protein ligase pli1; acc. no. O94451 [Pyronema omphalodes CBS 100304]